MFRKLRQHTIWTAALGAILLGQGILRSDDGASTPSARRLPPGVLAYFSIPDAVELRERFLETSFGKLVQDESLEEFRSQFDELWEQASQGIEKDLGLSASEVLEMVDGEATIAVLQPPGRSLGVVAMLGFGDHRETLDTILDQVREDAEEEGVTRTVESIEDTEVTVYTKENDQGDPTRVAYFLRDQTLVLSFSKGIDLLEDVLVRWDGEHAQTFADDQIYSYIMRKCQPEDGESQVVWYLSPIDLFRAVAMMPQANQGGISPAMALGFLPALGLDKFRAMGGASTLRTDEFDGVSRTFLYVNRPTSGVVKFFQFSAVRQAPPAWVPADVAAYSSANWDIAGAYEAVKALVDFFQPPGTLANAIDQLAQQGPQIHVKRDIIDSLTGRFQMLGETRDDAEPAMASPGVFALELRDSNKMTDVLARVAEFSDGKLNSREFRGTRIYEVEIPNFQGGPQQTFGVAVAKQQLFFASDVRLLEDYLRVDEAEEPLANSTDYRRVSSHFPSETSIISFSRPAAQLKPLYEMVRNGGLSESVEQIDFTTLPEFDELSDYFTTSGGYAVPDERGALFVNFSLRKE